MRAGAQLAPFRLFVECQRPTHRVVCSCRVCFHLERSLVIFRVEGEFSGPPSELLSRRRRVPKLTLVSGCAGRHSPDTHVQLLYAVNLHPSQIRSFFCRAPL
eukprot:3928666-Pleurochrysis_carterae.AAC.1